MRTAAYQLEVNKDILDKNLAKLRTSLNNLKDKRGNTEYLRYIHVQNDAYRVILDIENYLLLQMMRDTEEMAPYPNLAEDSVSNAD